MFYRGGAARRRNDNIRLRTPYQQYPGSTDNIATRDEEQESTGSTNGT